MAYAHEIKFFIKDKELYAALFDNPPFFCNEFWLKNIQAKELGILKLPENLQLGKQAKNFYLELTCLESQIFPVRKRFFSHLPVGGIPLTSTPPRLETK